MGFDTVTFIAQIINLAILVWLLKRFLYTPIVRAVDQRQAYIHRRIKEAEDEKARWEKENELLNEKQTLFAQQQKTQWDETLRKNKEFQLTHEQAFKEEYRKQLTVAKEELFRQRDVVSAHIQSVAELCVIDLLNKLASDFAVDSSVDKNIRLFQKALKKMPSAEKNKMQTALNEGEIPVIYTPHTLSGEQKKEINQIVANALNSDIRQLKFLKNDELIFGFRLQIGAYFADWNVKMYFNDIRRQFHDRTATLIDEGLNT